MVAEESSVVTDKDRYLRNSGYLPCRLKHRFEATHDGVNVSGRGANTEYWIHSRCEQCGAEKIDRRDVNLQRLHTRRTYPEGYTVTGTSITNADVWQFLIKEQRRRSRNGSARTRSTRARP